MTFGDSRAKNIHPVRMLFLLIYLLVISCSIYIISVNVNVIPVESHGKLS